MNPEQFNYFPHDPIQDYVHPMYTPSVDDIGSQYFDLGPKEMPFGEYQFADMHEVLNSDMYAQHRNPPFMYYPSHAVHDAHYVVSQPIGQPLPAHDSMRLLSMPEISLNPCQTPARTAFNPEGGLEELNCPLSPNHSKSRGRRASTRSEACDTTRHFMCAVQGCNKVFKRSEHLKRHVRSIHTLEKPFPCLTCGKTFSRTDNLNQHVRIHSRPKTKVSTIRSRQTNVQLDPLVGFMPFYNPHFPTTEMPPPTSSQYYPTMAPVSFP